jgi:hypothetical protein
MDNFPEKDRSLDNGLGKSRTMENALADLRSNHARHPSAALARMIEQLRAEIAYRQRQV